MQLAHSVSGCVMKRHTTPFISLPALWVRMIVPVVRATIRPATILGSAGRYWLFAYSSRVSPIATLSPVKTCHLGGFYGCFLLFTLVGLVDLLLYAQAASPDVICRSASYSGRSLSAYLSVEPTVLDGGCTADAAALRRMFSDRRTLTLFSPTCKGAMLFIQGYSSDPRSIQKHLRSVAWWASTQSIDAVDGFFRTSRSEDEGDDEAVARSCR